MSERTVTWRKDTEFRTLNLPTTAIGMPVPSGDDGIPGDDRVPLVSADAESLKTAGVAVVVDPTALETDGASSSTTVVVAVAAAAAAAASGGASAVAKPGGDGTHGHKRAPFWQRLREAYDVRSNLRNLFLPTPVEAQLPVLDGIRGFAMIWVMLTHSWIFLSWRHTGDPGYDSLQLSYALRLIRAGELSVDMFFVLSGFLIGHILIREHEKEGSVRLRSFFFRRFLRIAPTYYAVILIYWPILELINCPNCHTCTNYGWTNFLYVNNFVPSFFSCMGWTWSIAVEVQFYVLSPFIMWIFNKNRRLGFVVLGFLSLVMLIVRGLVLYLSGAMTVDAGTYMDVMYTKPYTRAGPYLVGLIMAGLYAVWRTRSATYTPSTKLNVLWLSTLVLAFGTMVILVFFGPGYGYDRPFSAMFLYVWLHRTVWGLCVAAIVFLCLMSSSLHQRRPRLSSSSSSYAEDDVSVPVAIPLWQRVVDAYRWVMSWRIWWVSAQLSYCAYLLHPMWMTIFYLVLLPDFEMSFLLFCGLAAVNLLVSNVLALPVHLFLERPFMNLRY